MHPTPLYRWTDDAALAFVAETSFAHVPVIVDGALSPLIAEARR